VALLFRSVVGLGGDCLGAHEAHPKTTLYGVVFLKLNGPLFTSAPGRRRAPRLFVDWHEIQNEVRAIIPDPKDCTKTAVRRAAVDALWVFTSYPPEIVLAELI
jgi:hypothetical protein